MELQGNIAYLWKNKIIMLSEHLQILLRKTTSKSRRCCNVDNRSESRRRKHNVVTMSVFGPSDEVGSTTLLCYPTSQPKNNQNPTLLQRRAPAGKGSLQGNSISGIFFNICLEDYLFIYSLFTVDVICLQ